MSSDLFDFIKQDSPRTAPLAFRMRPETPDEFFGHENVMGSGKPLRQWIETDRLPSIILWGPPGCGKTTLAGLIAKKTEAHFESLSAVLSGVKDIKDSIERARHYQRSNNRKTVLFVDEIHRFNKSQQDALLPHVEDGTVILIGATTENPSYELNSALLSRTRVIRLDRIDSKGLSKIIERALSDPNKGIGGFLKLSKEAIEWLSETSEGDARRALTALENLSITVSNVEKTLTVEDVKAALASSQLRQPIPHDKAGEAHYNVVSALIKSMRKGDPHAALYYLARMLEGGEDPVFISRRLVVFASEDIGNADPRAIQVAVAVKEACEFIGMPECRISLGQAVTYLASAPKSRASYEGIDEALEFVRNTGALPVPYHLRNTPIPPEKRKQTTSNFPEEVRGRRFYRPVESGLEKTIKEALDTKNRDYE